MSRALDREERRLGRAFKKALWALLAAPLLPAVACSARPIHDPGSGGTGGSATSGDQGSTTATTSTTGSAAGPSSSGSSSGQVDCTPEMYTPNPPDKCGDYVKLPCGIPQGVQLQKNCFLTLGDCHNICPSSYFNCHVANENCPDGGMFMPDPSGAVLIDCATCPNGVGRIPAALERAFVRRAGALGEYFAMAAHLEAASVCAFRRLGRELGQHGAPASLVRATARAARDEIRHARSTGRLAGRFGASSPAPRVRRLRTRSLEAVAIENAVEGCVRETFGALVATFQASRAGDPEIAREMRIIARDETRHAALSWAVARWAWDRLEPAARARLVARCTATVAELRAAPVAVDRELVRLAGLPSASERQAMLASLETELWASFDVALA